MTETAASTRVPVSIQLIGGPTALLEIGALRLLTDPAFARTINTATTRTGPAGRCARLSRATTGCGLSPLESASL
jgi:hypothetical protein